MWVTLPPSWKLQDVQAALNVIIGFLCAASVFVLVRSFWVLAAKKVAKKRDVPAYALLSLNTIGESIDIIWLLRHELLTARYRSLLVQCVFVLLLTACTLSSGFLARFSTRSVIIVQVRPVNGSLASRDETSLLNDVLDVSAVYDGLKSVNFPQTKLAEFWPDPNSNWTYNDAQFNSSWSMDCTYTNLTQVQNPQIATDNCKNGTWAQFLPANDAWKNWPKIKNNKYWSYTDDWISYSSDYKEVKDVYLFTYGVETLDWHEMGEAPNNYTITSSMTLQIVAWHLSGIPANQNANSTCDWAKGPMKGAEYTSALCQLKRNTSNQTIDDLGLWGSYPDWWDLDREVSIYTQFYSGRLRRESNANLPITVIQPTELVGLYQAYQVTKDTSGTVNWNITEVRKPKVLRNIDVKVRAAQVSLICVIICAILATIALLGIAHYWWFLLRNLKYLEQTPQSKLDWMLHTLRSDSSMIGKGSGGSNFGHMHTPSIEHSDNNVKIRHKLRNSVLVGSQVDLNSDTVPLTKLATQNGRSDKATSIVSTHSTDDYGYHESPATGGSDYATHSANIGWNSQSQYQQVGGQAPQYFDSRHGPAPSAGILGRAPSNQGRYTRVSSLPSPYENYSHMDAMDTAYDPARR